MKWLLILLLAQPSPEVKVREYSIGLRFLACDFILRNTGDGVYAVKWSCDG